MDTMAATFTALVQRQEALENQMKQAPVSTILAQPLGASCQSCSKGKPGRRCEGFETASEDISSASSSSCHYPAAQEILEVEGEQSAGASSGVERAMLAQSTGTRVLQERPNCRPSWPATMAASSMR